VECGEEEGDKDVKERCDQVKLCSRVPWDNIACDPAQSFSGSLIPRWDHRFNSLQLYRMLRPSAFRIRMQP
jgi:hypothetical protein